MNLYEQLLAKGKEAIADIERPFKVKKEKKNLEMVILDLEAKIANHDLTIQEQKAACPINWVKLREAIDTKEIDERKLKQYQALEAELFTEIKIANEKD